MHIHPAFIRGPLAVTLLLASAVAPAVEVPELEEPFGGWARSAAAEMDRFIAGPGSMFAMPPASQAVRCEASPAALSAALGIRLPGVAVDAAEAKLWASIGRGMKDGSRPTEYVDVVIRPVKATCADGRIEGPFSAWVEYTMVNSGAGVEMRGRYLKHVETTLVDGQRKGVTVERSLQLDTSMSFKDPAVAEMMRKNPPPKGQIAMFVWAEDDGAKSLHLMRQSMPPPMGVNLLTTVNRPTGNGRWESVSYIARTKVYVTRTKSGKMHGLQEVLPHRTQGVEVPASSTCYEDGEQIKTTQCDVQ
jgi:hypothetical protein